MPSLHLPLNAAEPRIMHIDLNSCFATVEQQARPLLRGRPVGITNRLNPYCILVAVSYEAKKLGVKVGMRINDAVKLAPGLIVAETDPPKYHYVYQHLVRIMKSYSPDVTMKSIDEGIIDFGRVVGGVPSLEELVEIGMQIKQRLKSEVGGWMRCNIGIAPNRFLAKTAAGLHKPNGLDIITHQNLRATLARLELTDLTGIANRNEARLNACGIYTPLQFLDAASETLRKRVFRSVCGDDWYRRLRGYETDDEVWDTKSVSRQFVMDDKYPTTEVLHARLNYLCENVGLKLRHKGFAARGVSVYARYDTGDYWHERKAFNSAFYSNAEICRRATLLFNRRPRDAIVRELGITCYLLDASARAQTNLLEEVNKQERLTDTIDSINTRYGEYTVMFAVSAPAKGQVKTKVPFGSTRYFDMLLSQA